MPADELLFALASTYTTWGGRPRGVVSLYPSDQQRWVLDEDRNITPLMDLTTDELGVTAADWMIREFGLTRVTEWVDLGEVRGFQLWRSMVRTSDKFETLMLESAYIREFDERGHPVMQSYEPELFPEDWPPLEAG
ncbi:hypothetical protein [Segniliparus rotundus]|uniref:hypothetical protein n=1 Tax=Segniliparus rotundus TaxID=286802 RepID=UPI000673FD5D|nr:hypothetical protein [Segniliparus rotundus]